MPSEHSKIMSGKCVACHLYKSEEEKAEERDKFPQKGGHTFRVDHTACLKCHKDPNSLVKEWQAKTSPLLKELGGLLENTADKKSDAYRAARLNYNLVRADGGEGIHNPRYAEALLKYSISALKTGSIWGE